MATTWMKIGVRGDLTRLAQKAYGKTVRLYYSKNLDFYWTSAREANHRPGSFHYIGEAFDFKRQGVSKQEILDTVGSGFQVIEYKGRDIFHVERDG